MPRRPAVAANTDASLLRHVLDDLDELLAALRSEGRERQPDDLTVVARVDPQVGVAEGLLDRADRGLVVGLDGEQPRLGHAEPRELLERDLRAVVVDRQLLDERRRRPPGSDAGELRPHRLDGLAHVTPRLIERLVGELTHMDIIARLTRPGYRWACPPGWTGRCPP